METVQFRLTGEERRVYGITYKVAECYDINAAIDTDHNILFLGDALFKSISCEGNLYCKGHLDCEGSFYQTFGRYKVGFNKCMILIGCEERTKDEWIKFIESDEEIETPRDHPNFPMILASISGAIAMQPYVLQRINFGD